MLELECAAILLPFLALLIAGSSSLVCLFGGFGDGLLCHGCFCEKFDSFLTKIRDSGGEK